jgi:hypothetical protein
MSTNCYQGQVSNFLVSASHLNPPLLIPPQLTGDFYLPIIPPLALPFRLNPLMRSSMTLIKAFFS